VKLSRSPWVWVLKYKLENTSSIRSSMDREIINPLLLLVEVVFCFQSVAIGN
jgi:hypothetical protein